MPTDFIRKSLSVLIRRQTDILSAAYVIMATVILSQILGVFRLRLLADIFSASNTLGIYFYAAKLPETLFQLTFAAALSSAFIPVFADFLGNKKEKEGHEMASTLLILGLIVFAVISVILAIFAPFFLTIFNLGNQFSPTQMTLMANLMRVIIVGQLFFILGTFFSALLQSYGHFFIPGIALAMYNLGIILGILLFSSIFHIYAAPVGIILGGIIFVLIQIPLVKKIGFHFRPSLHFIHSPSIIKIFHLMWPRTISILIYQLGSTTMISFISFLANPGRMHVIYDFAMTLAFAPVTLFGQAIAQAAFPILSREKNRPEEFREIFITSFNQTLYIILPISALILVLRIPIVRLFFGASQFDWEATVLTGRVLAFLSISIFAQALMALIYRAFYALHNTVIPLVVGSISTILMICISYLFINVYKFQIESLAFAFSISNIFQLLVLFILLDRKLGGFQKGKLLLTMTKFFFSTIFTGIALYIPIKLLDQLVFDTTRTINLIILTGISTAAGLTLYLFLTWLFSVKEAETYIYMLKRLGNWRDILTKSDSVIEGSDFNA
jgi:putative peptidoglycan lipid II flippase